MRVADGVDGPPVVVCPSDGLEAARRRLEQHGARHAVVLSGDLLVGTLSRRDLDAARPSVATSLTVGESAGRLAGVEIATIMRREPIVVAMATPLGEAARLMRDAGVDALPVLEGGRLAGLLTAEALLRLVPRLGADARCR